MKKSLFIVIALLGLMTEAWGQKVKPFEVELSVGTTYGLESYAGHRRLGPAFALEGRYNVSFLPIDFGAESIWAAPCAIRLRATSPAG